MAEQREKTMSVLLRFPGKAKSAKMELFAAQQWPEQPGAEAGLFRVRRDGRWVGGEDAHLFMTMEAVAALLARSIDDPWEEAVERRPPLARRERVRYAPVSTDKGHIRRVTWTMTDPFQGLDGRWRCMVVGEPDPVLCSDLEVLP